VLLASAVGVPLIVLGIVALVVGLSGGSAPAPTSSPTGPLPALTESAPPLASQDAASCAKVLAHLPVRLHGLDQRVVHTVPDTPAVVAWGEPPVVLSCGVARPASLHPGAAKQLFSVTADGPLFDVTSSGTDQVFTAVDRAAYISVEVPARYHAGQLPPLSRAIAAALPPVCGVPPAPRNRLCTRRS
jgi:hypothetical protein